MKRGLFILIAGILSVGTLQAQDKWQAVDSIRIFYRQGHRYVDPSYRENRVALNRFKASIDSMLRVHLLERVIIHSYASPDGTDRANTHLTSLRADSLASYLLRNTCLPPERLEKYSNGIAWDMLRNLVATSNMEYRNDVLHVLDNTPIWIYDSLGQIVDGRKKRLMELHGGNPYRYMYETFFPDLRCGVSAVLYVRTSTPKVDTVITTDPKPVTETNHPQTESKPKPTQNKPIAITEPEVKKIYPLFAIKTNLLYWATLMPDFRSYTFVPNLEIEWFFKNRWSLSGTGNFAKWTYGNNFLGISSWSIEPRWWFKNDGYYHWLYLGVYGQIGDYDVQNSRIENDGNTGNLWGIGLSFGGVIPFSNRLGLEIGIRGGYRYSEMKAYSHETPDYFLDYETQDNHWGITGLKASLYFRFGKGSK